MSSKVEQLLEVVLSRPLLTQQDLARRYVRDVATIRRWHRSGRLPKAIYLPGCRVPFWRPCDLVKFERNQK
jgi:hypothetical protein